MPPYERRVSPLDISPGDRLAQLAVHAVRSRHQQESRSLLVETMHDPRALRGNRSPGPVIVRISASAVGPVGSPAHQGVDECPRPVTRRRMDDHARRLVDHHEPFILVDDSQRNGLGHHIAPRRGGHRHGHSLASPKPVCCFLPASVDRDLSGRDQRGSLGARQLPVRRDDDIEAAAGGGEEIESPGGQRGRRATSREAARLSATGPDPPPRAPTRAEWRRW